MVREIRGTVLSVEPAGAVIDVAGWGILVYLPAPELLAAGNAVTLKTYLCIKQDGVDLYGFPTEEDRRFFELLVSVSGVGPKTAMSIFRKAPRQALEGAIGSRDLTYLTRVLGLGKKAAEKLIVELAEKMSGDAVQGDADAEVFDTLIALGYTEREARRTLALLPSTLIGKDERLKAALTSGIR